MLIISKPSKEHLSIHNGFFEIFSYLNQAVPLHLTDKSQTRQPDTPPNHRQDGHDG